MHKTKLIKVKHEDNAEMHMEYFQKEGHVMH